VREADPPARPSDPARILPSAHEGLPAGLLAAVMVAMHLAPLGMVLALQRGTIESQADIAVLTIPVLCLVAAGQIALVLAARAGDLVGFARPRSGAWLLAAPLVVAIVAVAGGTGLGAFRAAPPGALVTIAAAVVLVAFTEEVTFRGALLGAFLRRVGPWEAVALSALIFGLAHFIAVFAEASTADIARQAVGAAGLGAVLGLLRVRMGSIWPAIVLHALWNAAVLSGEASAVSITDPSAGGLLLPVLVLVLAAGAAIVVLVRAAVGRRAVA
jgi:uncharacterized protein